MYVCMYIFARANNLEANNLEANNLEANNLEANNPAKKAL